MFCSEQFGFRSKRNTTNALAEITEQIMQESNDTLTYTLLHLGKAFDSINHDFFS